MQEKLTALKPLKLQKFKAPFFIVVRMQNLLSAIIFTSSELMLPGQVNDSSQRTHLEIFWFRLAELDF